VPQSGNAAHASVVHAETAHFHYPLHDPSFCNFGTRRTDNLCAKYRMVDLRKLESSFGSVCSWIFRDSTAVFHHSEILGFSPKHGISCDQHLDCCNRCKARQTNGQKSPPKINLRLLLRALLRTGHSIIGEFCPAALRARRRKRAEPARLGPFSHNLRRFSCPCRFDYGIWRRPSLLALE